MFDEPNGQSLLEIARATLESDIIPRLEGEQKYAALMVASAMSIAGREIGAEHEPTRKILDAFAELYGQDNVSRAGTIGPERVRSLNTHLVQEIREGEYDDDMFGAVLDVLTEQCLQRLSLSNPRFLEASEYSQPQPT